MGSTSDIGDQNLHIEIGIFEVIAISFLTLSALSGVSLLIVENRFFNFSTEDSLFRLSTAIASGLVMVDLIGFLLAREKISPRIAFRVYFLVAISAFLFQIFRNGMDKSKTILLSIGVTISIGIWQFLPGLIIMMRSGVGLGMITFWNNDIANYVAISNEYLKTGFGNSHHIFGVNLNSFALISSPQTPTTVVAFISSAFGISAWEAAIPTIIVAFGFALLGINRLIRAFYPRCDQKTGFIIAAIIMTSALITYIYTNYFLGQIIAIGVSTMLLANMVELVKNARSRKILLVEATFLVALSIYSYPVFLLPFLLATFGFGVIAAVIRLRKTSFLLIVQYIIASGVGVLVSLPYLGSALGILKSQNSAVAGWPIPLLNPFGMFVWPQLIGFITPTSLLLVLWASLFLTIVLSYRRSGRIGLDISIPAVFSFLAIAGLIGIIIVRRHGFADYQSWKLMSFLIPLVLAACFPIFVIQKRWGKTIMIFALGVTSMSSMGIWGAHSAQTSHTSKDMLSVSRMESIIKMKSLNIDLNPWFETMETVSMINGPTLYVNSPSDWLASFNADACTLIRIGNPKYPFVKPLNATYGLATNKDGTCGQQQVFVKIGDLISFDAKGTQPLGRGWSAPETWGTWSDGTSASLDLPIETQNLNGLNLKVDSFGFLSKTRQSLDVVIQANSVKLASTTYSLTDNRKVRDYWIPAQVLKTSPNAIHLSFMIKDPISPKALGLSQDPRKLGIGLISIQFGRTRVVASN
jgi:hypothetical protein